MTQTTIHPFTGGAIQTNGFLVKTQHACFAIDAPAGMAKFIADSGLEPSHLLLTHQHFDHVQDCAALATQGLKILAHTSYTPEFIRDDFARSLGLPVNVPPFTVSQTLENQDLLDIGEEKITLHHVPGHSPDSLAFHLPDAAHLFAGDTLFQRGIGRSDLPGGDHEQLLNSIREKLFPLPDDTQVHPGHGPDTRIGEEKTQNPFP